MIDGPEDGLLVPVERADLLADALRALLTDADLRRRLARGARRRVEGAFSLELHCRRFEEAFLDLLEAPAPPPGADRR